MNETQKLIFRAEGARTENLWVLVLVLALLILAGVTSV